MRSARLDGLYTREKEVASRDGINEYGTFVRLLFVGEILNSMLCVFNLSLSICFQQAIALVHTPSRDGSERLFFQLKPLNIVFHIALKDI